MAVVPTSARVADDHRTLLVGWADGVTTEASAVWLFDNADGALDPSSGQRLHGALALDGARALAAVSLEDGDLRLSFTCGERTIPASALRAEPAISDEAEPWLAPDAVAAAAPIAFTDHLDDDDALHEALRRVVRHGLVFLTGCGTEPGAVARATGRFGYIRETNYGRTFDVREEARPSNLAYTTRGLDLHADNPYRDPPPSLQLLHAITVAPEGGENQFADGLAHALALAREAPDAYAILAGQSAHFRYTAPNGDRFEARAPIIETGLDGAPRIVRLNHRSLDTATMPPAGLDAWYGAYLDFYRRVHAPQTLYERRLAAGEMVIFDNWRMLHGRSAYQGAAAPRWLEGCYAERDGWLATLARLNRSGE